MKFIDWFAGIGGFRFGMEQAGHECIGFCEKDENAIASYTLLHLTTDEEREYILSQPYPNRVSELLKDKYKHNEWFVKDIRNVQADHIPEADVWCFGAPCTDFSLCRFNRKGLGGAQSGLVTEIFRLLRGIEKKSRPKWLVYENVEGMLSSNRGFDFATILIEMENLGYDIEWQVLNSKDFGIPQNRKRVYTIGYLGERCGGQILPLQTSSRTRGYVVKNEDEAIMVREATKRGYSLAEQGDSINFAFPNSATRRGRIGRQVANTFDHHSEQYVVEYIGHDYRPHAIEYTNGAQETRYTIIRRLTPIECLRAQGFSSSNAQLISAIHSDTTIYKQVANSVTVNVVYEIGRRLYD